MSDPDQRSSAATSPSPALVKQSLRVWLKMLKATKHVEATVREKLRIEFDTTLPRFDVMAALYRFEEGSQDERAVLGIARFQRQCNRASSSGLLRTVPCCACRLPVTSAPCWYV